MRQNVYDLKIPTQEFNTASSFSFSPDPNSPLPLINFYNMPNETSGLSLIQTPCQSAVPSERGLGRRNIRKHLMQASENVKKE